MKDMTHLPEGFALSFYEAVQRGERPFVPPSDDAGIASAERVTWSELTKPDNRFYGWDICLLRKIARIREERSEVERVAYELDSVITLFGLYRDPLNITLLRTALRLIAECRKQNSSYPITASLAEVMREQGLIE